MAVLSPVADIPKAGSDFVRPTWVWVYVEGSSAKFWTYNLQVGRFNEFTSIWGPIGRPFSQCQKKTKEFPFEGAARAWARDKAHEKERKGYKKIDYHAFWHLIDQLHKLIETNAY